MRMKSRWVALAIIFVSFLQFTLNWFNLVPAFGGLIADLHLSLPQVGVVIGMFIAGYGLAHIPGGMLAEAYGMRFAMLFGIAVETAGTALSAAAHSYDVLLVGRFICGVGGSVYIGSAIGLTTAWFRDHELATANGLITGVAFTVGASLGLYLWTDIVAALGWRAALLLGAAAGAITFIALLWLFPVPLDARDSARGVAGNHLNLAALRRTFGNRNLWLLGLSFLGAYGSYFTAAQLLPAYGVTHLQLEPAAANSLGVVLLTAGAVGGAVGGWLADKVFGVIPTMVGALIIESVALLLIPHLGATGLQIAAAAIGGMGILAFVPWIAMPGLYRDEIELSDIPTACGLMLTIVAIGGVTLPGLYGWVATRYGYTNAWTALAAASFVSMMFCFLVRRPDTAHNGNAHAEAAFK
ncbi:MFS transporter [Paraburkholderia acidicola]|uniref:MFS transporter n=1 Tax=Paraburkholderia acidicola TaxID=1912599 RepID=A0ABV1LSW1_9BURK